jgi:peptidoglycan/xylan/chitin deacetylase (PgdA/CDA1 family)
MTGNDATEQLRFSVVIPALDEELLIGACLDSLARQDCAGRFEVIVVDNGSRDRTAEIAREHGARVIAEPKRGVAGAQIAGCAQGRGEILAFTDADTVVPADWLSRLDQAFRRNPDAVAVGGPFFYNRCGFLLRLLTHHVLVPFYRAHLFPRAHSLSCANMAVRRTSYEASGGFDAGLEWGQDADLCRRLASLGRIVFDRRLYVLTSFRRYRGRHRLPLLQWLHGVKEFSVHLTRMLRLFRRPRSFPAEPPIRTREQSVFERVALNSATLVLALVLLGSAGVLAPSTGLFRAAYFHGPQRDAARLVALTFDDGPYGEPTSRILDILNAEHVKAAFFVTGENCLRYPDILTREVREGHLVENHSFDHVKVLAFELPGEVETNIRRTDRIIDSLTGLAPRFFRPPFGIRSLAMMRALRRINHVTVMWNDGTRDYDSRVSADAIARSVLRKLKPGTIIDLHDGRDTRVGYSRQNLVDALPGIIDRIRNQGYEIVRLDELIGERPYFPAE